MKIDENTSCCLMWSNLFMSLGKMLMKHYKIIFLHPIYWAKKFPSSLYRIKIDTSILLQKKLGSGVGFGLGALGRGMGDAELVSLAQQPTSRGQDADFALAKIMQEEFVEDAQLYTHRYCTPLALGTGCRGVPTLKTNWNKKSTSCRSRF